MSTSSWTNLLDLIYPIDSVYISVNDVYTPAELFGGTWVRLDQEACLRTCVSNGESAAGSSFRTYGADTFALSFTQLPPHKHDTVDVLRMSNVNGGSTCTVPSNAVPSSNDGSFLTGSTIYNSTNVKQKAQDSISRVPKYVECCVYRRTA